MRIIPLSEGAFSINQTKVFVPFDKTKDNLKDRDKGSILVEVQPFAVQTAHDVIVLDCGLGFTNADGTLQILQNLADNGIYPEDVTKVLLSHLHKDHSGGLFKTDETTGTKQLCFPNATYYVNGDEYQYALKKGRPSYETEDFEHLEDFPNVQFLHGDGVIDHYIKYEVTGGHCPYHMAFWIDENGEQIFFGADVAPQLSQMKTKYEAKYDYDGSRSMQLRQAWWELGNAEGWTFLFYHDTKTPLFKIS